MDDKQVEVGESLQRFIEREVSEGRFGSPREVVEAGLLMLEEREVRLAALRKTLAEAERASEGRASLPHGER
jgi:antitoxin ParD1/3/4